MSGGASTTTVVAVIGAVAAAAGAATSAAASMQQAEAAKAAAEYQSKVAAGNQQIALQNASFAAASGEEKAAIQEQKTRAQVGSIAAAEGSSGVDINSPTASAVRTSAGELGALDTSTIRSNAAREAYGYQTQAANFGNASSADISQGNNASIAGDVGAAGGLLSGFGSASTNYANVMGKASGIDTAAYSINNTTDQGGTAAYDMIQNSPGF